MIRDTQTPPKLPSPTIRAQIHIMSWMQLLKTLENNFYSFMLKIQVALFTFCYLFWTFPVHYSAFPSLTQLAFLSNRPTSILTSPYPSILPTLRSCLFNLPSPIQHPFLSFNPSNSLLQPSSTFYHPSPVSLPFGEFIPSQPRYLLYLHLNITIQDKH